MDTNKYLRIALAACAAIFLYEIWQISTIRLSEKHLEQDVAVLGAQIAHDNSASHLFSIGMKSFFDGFTFGAFADEGPFTESIKEDRFAANVKQRKAVILTAHSQNVSQLHSCATIRNWALLLGIAVVVYPFAATRIKNKFAQPYPSRNEGNA